MRALHPPVCLRFVTKHHLSRPHLQEEAIFGAGPKTRGCCAVLVLAVALQLGLMIALLRVETNAADAAATSAGVAGGGGPEREYCIISAGGASSVQTAVNAAMKAGCNLLGGLAVGHGDSRGRYYAGSQSSSMGETSDVFGQAMLCVHGTGCAK